MLRVVEVGGGILGAAVATVCGMLGPIRVETGVVVCRDVAGNCDVAGYVEMGATLPVDGASGVTEGESGGFCGVVVTEKGATDIGMVVGGGLYHVGAVRGFEEVIVDVEGVDVENGGLVAVGGGVVEDVEAVGRSGEVTPATERKAGAKEGMEGTGGELGLTEGAACPACETSGEGLRGEEGTEGVGDVMMLVMGGEVGAVEENGLLCRDSVEEERVGILELLLERGLVIGGEDGGELGLLCAKFLKGSGGVDIASGEIRGEELEE